MSVREEFLISGEWRKAMSTERISVVSPFSEEVIGEVPDANADDVDAAVERLERHSTTDVAGSAVGERADILDRALDILESKLDEICQLVTAEMGLPATFSAGVIPGGVATGRYFIKMARDDAPSEVRTTQLCDVAVIKEPVGVVASIAPWNGPFNMALSRSSPLW